MKVLLSFRVVVLIYIIVTAGDVALSEARTRPIVRPLAYGAVAMLALIALLITLIGV